MSFPSITSIVTDFGVFLVGIVAGVIFTKVTTWPFHYILISIIVIFFIGLFSVNAAVNYILNLLGVHVPILPFGL